VETASVETAIEELVKGPDDTSMQNCVPEGTEVAGVQMESGVLYVNFTEPFKDLKNDPVNEMMVMRALAMTVKDFPDIEDVKVLVDGKDYDYNISIPTFANEYN
jgi:germination protein M